MEDNIQQPVAAAEPQVANEAPVENTVQPQEPQVEQPQAGTEQPVVDTPVENVQQQEPTTEELKARLHEYEVKEEEARLLKEKLGIQDMDSQTYNYMNVDQQIVNMGKQAYLRLCNEYGVDADPNNIDASVNALRETDPKKAYEFERRFEALGNDVAGRRAYVQQQNAVYEVNKFAGEYNELLQASPALSNIITQYVRSYGNGNTNMYGQLHGVMDVILPAYKEAFEAGRQYALSDNARRDTSAVSGGTATANTQTYSPGNVFTRDQISKMSPDEFAKYESEIHKQMVQGLIK